MKLEDYNPEIENMVYIKSKKRFIKIVGFALNEMANTIRLWHTNAIGDLYNESFIIDDVVFLPYTNCKDKDGNKLYFANVLFNEKDYFIILFDKAEYYVRLLCSNKESCFTMNLYVFTKGVDSPVKRIGSIYELPEIQKQFNIEV